MLLCFSKKFRCNQYVLPLNPTDTQVHEGRDCLVAMTVGLAALRQEAGANFRISIFFRARVVIKLYSTSCDNVKKCSTFALFLSPVLDSCTWRQDKAQIFNEASSDKKKGDMLVDFSTSQTMLSTILKLKNAIPKFHSLRPPAKCKTLMQTGYGNFQKASRHVYEEHVISGRVLQHA